MSRPAKPRPPKEIFFLTNRLPDHSGHSLEPKEHAAEPVPMTARRLIDLIAEVNRNTQRAIALVARSYGIPIGHYELLTLIDQEPDLTQKRISFQLGMTAGNLTQVLNKLEALGYLSRQQLWREKRPFITPKGKELLNSVRPEIEELEKLLFRNLPEENLARMADDLKILLRSTARRYDQNALNPDEEQMEQNYDGIGE